MWGKMTWEIYDLKLISHFSCTNLSHSYSFWCLIKLIFLSYFLFDKIYKMNYFDHCYGPSRGPQWSKLNRTRGDKHWMGASSITNGYYWGLGGNKRSSLAQGYSVWLVSFAPYIIDQIWILESGRKKVISCKSILMYMGLPLIGLWKKYVNWPGKA